MNIILSLIVSIAMIFSGVSELPAVPETASVTTIRDITFTYGDETVELNPQLRFTGALGAQQADIGFEILLDDQVLMPVRGRIDGENVTFALSEDGKAYTVSDDAIAESIGLNDAGINEMLKLYTEAISLLPALSSASADQEMTELLLNSWLKDGELEMVEVDLDGESLLAKRYDMEISIADVIAGLDVLQQSKIEAVRDYARIMLEFVNMAAEGEFEAADFASLADLLPEEAKEVSLPMEIIIGSEDGMLYEQAYVSTEVEGMVIDVNALSTVKGDAFTMEMDFYMGNEETYMNYAVSAWREEDGSGSISYDVSSGSTYSYDIENEDGTIETQEHGDDTYMYVAADFWPVEDGLMSGSFSMNVSNSGVNGDYSNETIFTLAGDESQVLEEDGSISTDCYFTLVIQQGNQDGMLADEIVEFSCQINQASVPFEDAFAGREMMELTAADLRGETDSTAINSITADALAFTADAMTLSVEESIMELVGMFEGAGEEIEMEPAYTGDEWQEYTAEYPENLDEAYAAYGYPVPEIAIPEGYVPSYVNAMEGYINIDYEKDDQSFSVNIYPNYGDTQLMMLQPDGSLVQPEGKLMNVAFNEDGSVYFADFTDDEYQINIYAYFEGMTLEDVQAMLASLA